MLRAALVACLGLLALPAQAEAVCRDQVHEGRDYTVCEVTAAEDLRLFQTAPDGEPFGTFDRINEALASEGATLGFAMNAGMYHPDRAPVGLMIENGEERARIVTSDGPGNFGLFTAPFFRAATVVGVLHNVQSTGRVEERPVKSCRNRRRLAKDL